MEQYGNNYKDEFIKSLIICYMDKPAIGGVQLTPKT